jgi:ferrous iron transport protein B
VGNPNCGKSTLFNGLTGLRQKVGNYPGVTVEKKEGRLALPSGGTAVLLDLPGTYSLTPHSPDESITTAVLLGTSGDLPSPDLVICVIDATNLERHLYLALQIMELGLPIVVALNMIDVARKTGVHINTEALSNMLGVPVVATVASQGEGLDDLAVHIAGPLGEQKPSRQWKVPDVVERELRELVALLTSVHTTAPLHTAIQLLSSNNGATERTGKLSADILQHVEQDRQRLDFLEVDRSSVFVEARYAWIREACRTAVSRGKGRTSPSDRVDALLLHPILGYLVFLVLMAVMFQSVFSWATIPMDMISSGFQALGGMVEGMMPPGDLRDLIVNGGIAGVSAVVTFLPQILFLFLFLAILEDSGYMARAAFIMDRLMSKVGLHGKSFIPLLGSFACAIPGIMATRTIESPKDRLVTMLVAPLMGCSARLPVYTLMIAAFVPDIRFFGAIPLPGLVLFGLYVLGLTGAVIVAWLFKKTILRGAPPMFVMELPAFRRPSVKSIAIQVWERGLVFLREAGTFILAVSIVLWFLATYPRLENASPAEQMQQSFAGRAGQMIEPLIEPLGFNWKIGLGLFASVLQREVFVSTMGTIYNIESADEGSTSLQEHLRNDVHPETGMPTFTLLTAICVMVYYVFAMQCLSTVAVMRRETNGWKWPLFQMAYMTILAYAMTFLTYRIGMVLGLDI